jgi:RNA recognition motif-containing protein
MNIYVGNLSLETSEDELRREFAEFGQVISVIIMNDEYIGSGQRKGYGYIEMSSKSEGVVAIANLNGKRLKGRILNIVEALPLSEKNGNIINKHRNGYYRSNRSRERKYQIS